MFDDGFDGTASGGKGWTSLFRGGSGAHVARLMAPSMGSMT